MWRPLRTCNRFVGYTVGVTSFRRIGAILGLLAFGCVQAKEPKNEGRSAIPACPRGAFMAQMDQILPALSQTQPVMLVPASAVRKKVEPGCVVPFRNEPDDRVLDVGRVVGRTMRKSQPGEKPALIGRGRLQVGRRVLRLSLLDDAGTEMLDLAIDGAHVRLREKGQKPFEADVAQGDTSSLPLPLDALVAAIDRCDDDLRLGKTADGNVIEARRGQMPLWRWRWIDSQTTSVIDTSIACDAGDARMLWRTAAGDMLPSIAVASTRSERVLVIVRQKPSQTDDADDFGLYR
jgi:hypothetical protein